MTPVGGLTYSGEIPPQADGAFVSYWVEAEDNTGARSRSEIKFYRVLVDGINEIRDIQETFGGGPGPSPFEGITTDMDITAVVQSRPGVSGFVAIQDDASLSPWTGILLRPLDATLALEQGDVIHISRAYIYERFGVTQLDSLTFSVQSNGDIYGYKEMTTQDMQLDQVAEAHEAMLVQFNNVVIVDNDAGFGEWRFSSDGTMENSVLADDASQAIPRDYAATNLENGMSLEYIRGIWWYSFGNYKLVPEDTTDIKIVGTAAEEVQPGTLALEANYPNPFREKTEIGFSLDRSRTVQLEVFDVMGRKVATLVNGVKPAGVHRVSLDAQGLPAGVYFYRLAAGDQVFVRQMMIVK